MRVIFWIVSLAPAAALISSAAAEVGELPAASTKQVDYGKDVRPIIEASCLPCHGPAKRKGDLVLTARADALKGGERGVVIVPGKSAESPLIQFVAHLVRDMEMPPPGKGKRLTAGEISVLRAWIDQGAKWGDEEAVKEEHWAFQPVSRPATPTVSRKNWVRNEIDHFVLSRLESEKLSPSAEAERRILIRRLYFVMLGMPPTPEEVAKFLLDAKPDAYERLVDQVLADPRYGERWGRHWLDVVRFAESNGFETNRERPNAWRFRDYVIEAFNQDKPYDQFIREQLAGDAIGADVATGFLVGGPVDIVKSPDPKLTAQQRADELDDMVATTGTAFLGLTLGCARCHSHKFDPISQTEYYSLTALLGGVQHGERALPLPQEQKEALGVVEARIKDLEQKLSPFLKKPNQEGEAAKDRQKLRPPVNARANEEAFAGLAAKFVRFTISETTGGEPCIDELEVYSGDRSIGVATNGTKAKASGTLPGYEIHKLEHINDGRVGNGRSWISSESGRGWVELELPQKEMINRIVWGRDREGVFSDRVATKYRVEVAVEPDRWVLVASSEDREPFVRPEGAEQSPTYYFEGRPVAEAAEGRSWLAELEAAKTEKKRLQTTGMVYAGNFTQPAPAFRLFRGDPLQPREPVPPATLALFEPLSLPEDAPEQERRKRLAEWIVHPKHPLTARVLANRIWQYQFGTGLVDTPNDFGKNGSRPTHPELLDWLASELVRGGWSIKALQRLILTSATWRQSSTPSEAALQVDAGSRFLWRFPPRRLEAEGIRDSMLMVSGQLDRSPGGPSFFLHNVDRENVYHYHPKEEFGPSETRRMVYAFKVRMEQDGVFGAFDCPDGSLVMPKRSASTTPLQALNLFNSGFTLQQAEQLANRLRTEAGPEVAGQIRRAWDLAFNRAPSAEELEEAVSFAKAQGLPALCRVVFNTNEFLFIP